MTTPEFYPNPSPSLERLPDSSVTSDPSRSSCRPNPLLSDRSGYSQGVQLAESGSYSSALTVLNRAVTLHPHDHLAWTLRGVVLVCLGQYEAAIASCDRALMIQPDHSKAWKFRGMALHGLNRYREAYQSYDRALGVERQSILKVAAHWIRQHLHKPDEAQWHPLDALLS